MDEKKETIYAGYNCVDVWRRVQLMAYYGTGGIPGAGGSRLAEISF